MSGIAKGVKKVFKKTAQVVKKIAKPLAIGAAVYFTAGLALSAIPATASFAASMPGLAGAGGAGIFGKAAAASGALGSGAAAGAGAALQPISVAAKAIPHTKATVGALKGMGYAGKVLGSVEKTGGIMAKVGAAWKGMSVAEKLMLASTGTSAISALMAPTLEEEVEATEAARARFRGAFYGMDAATGEHVEMPRMQVSERPEVADHSQRQVNELIAPEVPQFGAPQNYRVPMPGPGGTQPTALPVPQMRSLV